MVTLKYDIFINFIRDDIYLRVISKNISYSFEFIGVVTGPRGIRR